MTTIKKYSLRLKEEPESYQLNQCVVNQPEDAAEVFCNILDLDKRPQETLAMITIDVKNQVTGIMEVSTGTLSSSAVHPRDVFQRAILQNAAGIIIAHNHPSGIPDASSQDIQLTQKLVQAGDIIGIDLLDHIIIGDKHNYISMQERDMM